MAQFLGPAFLQSLNASAVPLSGGTLEIYVTGTTTPLEVFSDEALSTSLGTVLTADSAGVFPTAYTSATKVKVIQKTSAGTTVRTADPVYTIGNASNVPAADVSYDGGTSGLASDNVQDAIDEVVTLQGLTQSWETASDGVIATGTSTNAGATSGPEFDLYRNSASPAASDIIGGTRHSGKNAAGTKVIYSQDRSVILDTTNGSEDGKRVFQTMVAGSLADRVHIGAGIWGEGATGTDPGAGKANFTEVQQSSAPIRPLVSATVQASTSGTAIDFTSVPSWVKRITVTFVGVSTNGSADILLQIGDSGGIETTGYLGTCSFFTGTSTNYTTGFGLKRDNAAQLSHGSITLTLHEASSNTWVASGVLGFSGAGGNQWTGGSKPLSAALDRVRITSTDTFDAGSVNILYE